MEAAKVVAHPALHGELRRAVASLHGGEDIFVALAAHTPVGIFISDADGKTLYVNERWCELAGITAAEAMGDGWRVALHPDDLQRIEPEWAEAAAAGRDSTVEYRFVRPDGSVSWIEGYAAALHGDDGRLLGWVGTCLDFTARKQAEEQLREAFDSAPIGMALIAPDGRWLQVNEALCDLIGYTADELVGMTYLDVTHPEDLEASLEHTRRQLDGEVDRLPIEKRYLRKDGTAVWVALTSTVVHDPAGRPSHFVAQIEDVTDRVLAQRALQEAEERFRRAFDDAPIGMALVGLDGRWLRVNASLCEITGYSEDELLARTYQDITHPDDLEPNVAAVSAVVEGRAHSLGHEKRYVRPDGESVWVRVSSSLVRDGDGLPVHLVSQIEDISDRRRDEERLKDLADHDSLTGLLNRRRFDEELRTAVLRLRRHGGRTALVLLDLDRFKLVNDTHGHKAGDDVLGLVAGILRRRLRATDVVARLGGDEFAGLLFDTTAEDAVRVVGDLVSTIRASRITGETGEIAATASAGVVALEEYAGVGGDEALVAADRALYGAKSAGRDRIAVG